MRLVASNPRVIIEDGAVGWHVYIEMDDDTIRHPMHFEDRTYAQAYARGLSLGENCLVEDRSTAISGLETFTPALRLKSAESQNPYTDDGEHLAGRVIPFPLAAQPYRGTICVTGDQVNGFQVSHNSAGSDNWEPFSNYASGQEAITAAYVCNRDIYFGGCNVMIGEAALQDRKGETASFLHWEDF